MLRSPKRLWLLALLPVVGLGWAIKSAASWRPQVFGVQKAVDECEFSPDGNLLLASASLDQGRVHLVQVWDVRAKAQKSLWGTEKGWPPVFSPNSQMLAVIRGISRPETTTETLKGTQFDLLNARSGKLIHSLEDLHSRDMYIGDIIRFYGFSPDNREFLLATSRRLRRWNVRTGKLLSVLQWKTDSKHHLFYVDDGKFLSDGESILVDFCVTYSPRKQGFGVFDVATARLKRSLPLAIGYGGLLFSPDDYSIWTVDETMKAFRLTHGQSLPLYVWPNVNPPVFSPDGKLAYSPTKTGLDVLDAHTGAKLRHLPGPLSGSFAPSPDGNWLYEARDGKIWKWRAR